MKISEGRSSDTRQDCCMLSLTDVTIADGSARPRGGLCQPLPPGLAVSGHPPGQAGHQEAGGVTGGAGGGARHRAGEGGGVVARGDWPGSCLHLPAV